MNESSESKIWAIWQLGFRSFFLCAVAYSALSVLKWIGVLSGLLSNQQGISPLLSHPHEMIFGFSCAVIAGFILTAVQNWTGIPGIKGTKLKFLLLLWLIPRLFFFFDLPISIWISILDLSFFPILGIVLIPYFKDPEIKKERFFYVVFLLLFTGNLMIHLSFAGITDLYVRKGLFLGLNTVLAVVVMIGGRVIPFFSEGTIIRLQPKTYLPLEVYCIVSTWLYLVMSIFDLGSSFAVTITASIFTLVNSIAHLLRVYGWYVRRVRRVPLLWILYSSYLWISVGFFLTSLSLLGFVGSSIATHAFTVGGVGGMIYGMIARVSLGHTGRKLKASPAVVVGFVLMIAAAFIRVFGPLLDLSKLVQSFHSSTVAILLSGSLWVSAFVILFFVYLPILTSKRVDEVDAG